MNKKGVETRNLIKEKSRSLFEKKGFKEITMKDICEITGLSRGGLYCHYDSTEQIFLEIINSFLDSQNNDFETKMQANIPAADILNFILEKYKSEMLNAKESLSLAIYEYFSSTGESNHLLQQQYMASFHSWTRLIEYGIERDEFNKVDIHTVFDLILFSYQGVRMYSRLININADVPERIISQIKALLLKEKDGSK